jgi:arabinoxylan arabinofuranohydrolase
MNKYLFKKIFISFMLSACIIHLFAQGKEYSGNPLFKDIFTADPCALVHDDTLYLFTGHDEQTQFGSSFLMRDWHIYSTADMVNWTSHGARLKATDFSWASGNAFAGHVTEHNGKFYWYVSATHNFIRKGEGFAIGVAVADHPLGPYKDVTGKPLITDNTPNSIALNIDPAVYMDNGTPWLFWGSWGEARMVKLKDSMTELDGLVTTVNAQDFFEAPWIHKLNNLYYLSYASGYPSTTKYSTSTNIEGPWTYQGVINDLLPNSETNHQAIIEFKGNWYFVYHNGALPDGGTYRRSVCIDKLEYNANATIKKVVRTTKGVPAINTTNTTPKFHTENNIERTEQPFSEQMINYNYSIINHGTQISTYNLLGIRKKIVVSPGVYIFASKTKETGCVKDVLIKK